ncbi:MAG: polyprenyl synthetase family protein [Parachlamydiaceae bacterium]
MPAPITVPLPDLIKSYIHAKTALIEQRLDTLIPNSDKLFTAARHSLFNGAKRLRPLLTIAAAETLGGTDQKALSAACALEMIHTYSLIHDDLPCMDDDDFRRGKPSLHRAFDEATAVLTGDYLLTYAFEVVADDEGLTASQKVSLIKLMAYHSGGQGMIGGQMMDIEVEGISITLEHLERIHSKKTGALIIASLLCGAVTANATPAEMDALTLFGRDVGLAFQIIDDIIDVVDSERKHGKKIASDSINNKTTYVTLMDVDTARHVAYNLYERSISHLEKITPDTILLQELAKRLVHRHI